MCVLLTAKWLCHRMMISKKQGQPAFMTGCPCVNYIIILYAFLVIWTLVRLIAVITV